MPDQLVSEINSLAIGLVHDARFLRDSRAAERTQKSWQRLINSYHPEPLTVSPPPIQSFFPMAKFRTIVRRKETS